MWKSIVLIVSLSAVLVTAGGEAFSWEGSYEGDVLPDSPDLGDGRWWGGGGPDPPYIEDGVLRTVDASSMGSISFCTLPFPAGTPVTAESRLRVSSASSPSPERWEIFPGLFSVSTFSGGVAVIGLYTDKVVTYSGDNQYRDYAVDMTQWRTFRIALTSDNWSYVWMDGDLIFFGFSPSPAGYGQAGVAFGTNYVTTADIQWDYVRYSKEFLPIPEPASLLALAAGLGALALRRRRTQPKRKRRAHPRPPGSIRGLCGLH